MDLRRTGEGRALRVEGWVLMALIGLNVEDTLRYGVFDLDLDMDMNENI